MIKQVKEVVAKLSLEEKIELIRGKGLWKTAPVLSLGLPERVMTDGTYGVRYNAEQIENQAFLNPHDFLSVVRGDADGEARGGAEALVGKAEPATCFPNGSNLSCSWDIDLMKEVGAALAAECHHYGVSVLLGPGINIRRTPLAGRGYEYYSEDPVVSGDLAAGLIQGLQENGIGAVIKHFACNNSEYKRTEMNSVVDERTLREIYLSGFHRAIRKSNPWAVMTSYNDLNGQATSSNSWLLTDILRSEWGYDGLVMSDWYGVKDCAAAIKAGTDLIMPEVTAHADSLERAVKSGELAEDALDRACERVLTQFQKLPVRQPLRADFNANHALARRAAAESIVLLKNENGTLPILPSKYRSIGVIGKPAMSPVIQGSGCATTAPYSTDVPLDEIFDLAGSRFQLHYAVGASGDVDLLPEEIDEALALAKNSDVVILFASTAIGEDGENGDRANLSLLASHELLIDAVTAVSKNVVVVLSNSDSVIMPWIDKVPAVLETFFAGQGMGRAVAEIILGQRNPCGKLTVTVPNALEETPAWLYYPGEHLQHYYSEGLFVGYRYYDKRLLQPLFPFGFGLSYSHFIYQSLTQSTAELRPGETLSVEAVIENDSPVDGKEIVQLYLMSPVTKLPREPQALKAFAKVRVAAGKVSVARLSLDYDDFAYYDVRRKQWVVEPGEYHIHVSRSSRHRDLLTTVHVLGDAPSPVLNAHSSLKDLIESPAAFNRVLNIVSAATGQDEGDLRRELIELAPQLVSGTYITLVEMMGVDISMETLVAALN